MKIGLQIPSFTWPGGPSQIAPTLARIGRAAEEAGFASLWVMDHFFKFPDVSRESEQMGRNDRQNPASRGSAFFNAIAWRGR